MVASARFATSLCLVALAALAALAAGCAGTPRHASAQAPSAAAPVTASTANSPASESKLVRTADLAAKAEQEGWHPLVRDGRVFYCKSVTPMLSMIPRRTCLSKSAIRMEMLAEERQRENMQRAGAAACPTGASCQ